MNISQSAVSRQIQLLESELKCQLIIRSNKIFFLTPAGERLYQQSRQFDQWCELHFSKEIPEIRIGCLEGVLDSWLIAKLKRIKSPDFPNLDIQILTDNKIHMALNQGQLDIVSQSASLDSSVKWLLNLFFIKHRVPPNWIIIIRIAEFYVNSRISANLVANSYYDTIQITVCGSCINGITHTKIVSCGIVSTSLGS